MNETIKLTGYIKYVLTRADGSVKDAWEGPNLVVTAGKTALAAWLAAATQSAKFMPYIALGSGTSAASASDTALGTELARVAGTITSASNVYQNVASFPAGTGTGTIAELGLLSASSSGTLFARQVFTARPKDATDTLTVTWAVTFA